MKKISVKQAAREKHLAKIKREMIAEEIAAYGYATCKDRGERFGPEAALLYLDLDHIVQRSLGGTDDRSNLQLLCRQCHGKKHP